jgi:hypothetical protein
MTDDIRSDHPSVAERIDELRQLEDGWLDGEGEAPDDLCLDILESDLREHKLPCPYIYPTVDGNVTLEWERPNGRSLVLEIDFDLGEGELFGVGIRSCDYDLSDDDSWHRLKLDVERLLKPSLWQRLWNWVHGR